MEKVLEVTINSISVGVINENIYREIENTCKKSKALKAKQFLIICKVILRMLKRVVSSTATIWVWVIGVYCIGYKMEFGTSVVTEKSLIDLIGITFTISFICGILLVLTDKMLNGIQDVEKVISDEINNRVRLAIGCSTVGKMEILNG